MGKLTTSVGIVLLFSLSIYSQSFIINNVHPYSSSLFGSAGGGVTIGMTDYKNIKPGIDGFLSASYFFSTSDQNILGLNFKGGILNIKGKDENKILYAPDGTILRPDIFNTDAVNLSASVLYSYAVSKNFIPYAGAGLSYYFFSPKDENGQLLYNNRNDVYDKNTLGFDAEVGISVPLSDLLNVELNSTFHFLFTDYIDDIAFGKNKDFFSSVSLGISYAFISNRDSDGDGIADNKDLCPNTPPGVTVDEFGCPLDTDGDGVPDYLDDCPNTPKGMKVDKNGCAIDSDNDGIPDTLDKCPNTPRGMHVNEFGCPDTDGDGVFDNDDKCPDTPKGVTVDKTGCPIDSDGDGVPDYLDKCPDTPKGERVDKNGCLLEAPKTETGGEIIKNENTIILPADNIFFNNRAEIKPEAYKVLDDVVAQLKKYPNTYWRIEGHMDSQGPDQWIRSMSSKRAEAIYYYFISHGLDASKFTIYGLGDKFPIANNTTEEGRAKNRRIAIVEDQQW